MPSVRKWIQEQAETGGYFFTLEGIRSALSTSNPQDISTELKRACKARLISRAWQGFYLILPPVYAKQGTLPVPMYLDALMKHLKRTYCVALLNAAAFYGAAHQSPQSFTVMTGGRVPRSREHAGTCLEFVAKNEFSRGIPEGLVREFKTPTGYINVSSPEFTALTLVQYADRVGGLSRVLSVLEELVGECDFRANCPDGMLACVPVSCFQRLGYMVEDLLGEETQGDALYSWLQVHSIALRKTLLAPASGRKDGEVHKRWKLVINETLESDYI